MRFQRGRCTAQALCAAVVVGLAASSPAQAVVPLELTEPDVVLNHRTPKGTILMAHAGAFLFGSPRVPVEKALSRRFRGAGYDVRGLAYPLFDYPAAVAYAVRAARRARRHGPVFVVGQSAGGALAAELATRRLVDGAVLVAGLTDFRAVPISPERQRYYERVIRVPNGWASSPIRGFARSRRAPVYAFHSPFDRVMPFSQSLALNRHSGVRLRRLSGRHLDDRSWVPEARRWLDRLASRARARGSSSPSGPRTR